MLGGGRYKDGFRHQLLIDSALAMCVDSDFGCSHSCRAVRFCAVHRHGYVNGSQPTRADAAVAEQRIRSYT